MVATIVGLLMTEEIVAMRLEDMDVTSTSSMNRKTK